MRLLKTEENLDSIALSDGEYFQYINTDDLKSVYFMKIRKANEKFFSKSKKLSRVSSLDLEESDGMIFKKIENPLEIETLKAVSTLSKDFYFPGEKIKIGSIFFRGNQKFENLEMLRSLKRIDGSLVLTYNENLNSLIGLEGFQLGRTLIVGGKSNFDTDDFTSFDQDPDFEHRSATQLVTDFNSLGSIEKIRGAARLVLGKCVGKEFKLNLLEKIEGKFIGFSLDDREKLKIIEPKDCP